MKLLNLRLIDGVGNLTERVDIEIEGDKFKSITPSAEHASSEAANPAMADTLDLRGYTALPGLFNCHVHMTLDATANPNATLQLEPQAYQTLQAAKRGQSMLEAGITTARDLGGLEYIEMSVKRAFNEGLFPGPRLLVSGKVLTMTGGHGNFIGEEVDGTDMIRRASRRQLKAGADCIKMMASGGVMTPGVDPRSPQLNEDELRAGFEEAHKAGKITASHAQATAGIKNAIRAGVRTIEHGFWMDDEALNMMLERGTFFVPTLAAPAMIVEFGEASGVPKYMVDKARLVMEDHHRSVANAHKSGVKVACGSDAGTPFNRHDDVYTEMTMLGQTGLSNMEVITAATSVSAEALKLDDKLGRVVPNFLADLVVVKGDPLAELGLLQKPAMVWKAGQVVKDEG